MPPGGLPGAQSCALPCVPLSALCPVSLPPISPLPRRDWQGHLRTEGERSDCRWNTGGAPSPARGAGSRSSGEQRKLAPARVKQDALDQSWRPRCCSRRRDGEGPRRQQSPRRKARLSPLARAQGSAGRSGVSGACLGAARHWQSPQKQINGCLRNRIVCRKQMCICPSASATGE